MTRAAETAAKVLRRDFVEVENLQVSTKGPSDFVTAADKRAEEIIQRELMKARPEYGYIMEEGGILAGSDKTANFIIDPIDGTNNFIHGIPHWAIAIALQIDGEITAAMTYDVCKDETFWAVKGGGAWLNERRLRVSGRKDMGMASVCSWSPAKGRGDMALYTKQMATVLPNVSAYRRLGAASLDLAYVAAGRVDAYWEANIKLWDIAGGTLLVTEAGGRITKIDGSADYLSSGEVLATNGHLHQDMLKLLAA